jgi:hypothetical protein
VEKAWSTHGAYAQTDYIRRVAQRARETHLAGMVGRARLHGDHSFDDSHEVNLYAFSRFMSDPDLSVDQVLTEWAGKRYPQRAVPWIVSAMTRTEFINHHGRWHLQEWLTKSIGSEWGDYRYYYARVLERSRFKWTHDPADKELEEKLYHPDQATFDKLVAEKDQVIAQTRASIADLHQASRYLTAEQMKPLEEDFRFLLDAALLQREWIRAYFAMRMYMDEPNVQYKSVMDDGIARLEAQEKNAGVTYGLNPETGRRYNIDAFVLEMRWRVQNRWRAQQEDDWLLDEVRRIGDVANR